MPAGSSMRSAVLVALFGFGLIAPALDLVLRPDSARSTAPEHRTAAALPRWPATRTALREFPHALELYVGDSLGWRDQLLRWNSLQQLELFGRFPSSSLYTGRDGWWYYGENDGISAWRGLKPFREGELEYWRRSLETQRDWLRARGIEFLFVLAPNKETIYPEHLPAGYERLGPTRMEQFAEYMAQHSDVHFLDLRATLLAEKRNDTQDDLLYYPLGTHWTQRGAWIAYREILHALRAKLTCLSEAQIANFVVKRGAQQGDSWADRLYAADRFRQACYEYDPRDGFKFVTLKTDDRPGVIRRQCPGADCESLLLLHDSFGFKTDCFLAEHFRHQLQCSQIALEEDLVDEARPQAVIEIYAEFKLLIAPPRLVLRQDAAANRARFERAGTSLFLWSAAQGAHLIEGRGGALVEAAPGATGVVIRTTRPAQTFLTPELPFPHSGNSILLFTIESQTAQTLDVFYLREGDSEYERSRSFQLVLAAGRNEIHHRLDDPQLRGRLSLRPRMPGELRLERIELRTVPGD